MLQGTLAHALPLRPDHQAVVQHALLQPHAAQTHGVRPPTPATVSAVWARRLRREAAAFAQDAPIPPAVELVATVLGRAGVRPVADVVDGLVRAGALEGYTKLTGKPAREKVTGQLVGEAPSQGIIPKASAKPTREDEDQASA